MCISSLHSLPWVCGGDCNKILSHDEENGAVCEPILKLLLLGKHRYWSNHWEGPHLPTMSQIVSLFYSPLIGGPIKIHGIEGKTDRPKCFEPLWLQELQSTAAVEQALIFEIL